MYFHLVVFIDTVSYCMTLLKFCYNTNKFCLNKTNTTAFTSLSILI